MLSISVAALWLVFSNGLWEKTSGKKPEVLEHYWSGRTAWPLPNYVPGPEGKPEVWPTMKNWKVHLRGLKSTVYQRKGRAVAWLDPKILQYEYTDTNSDAKFPPMCRVSPDQSCHATENLTNLYVRFSPCQCRYSQNRWIFPIINLRL